jgi:hypothetical protein
MIEREKVIKGLTAHMNGDCNKKDCPWFECENDECIKSMFDAALKLLKEQEQTPSGWISVNDRMPETCHAVLVYTPHYKNIWAATMHEDGNWYIWSPGGRVLLDPDWYGPITHWMPLPEPPKEGR